MRSTQKNVFMRSLSAATAIIFLVTSTAPAAVTNLRGHVGKYTSHLNRNATPEAEAFQELTTAQLAATYVPPVLGNIEDRFTGKDPRFVLIAQDTHCNYEAQNNFAQTMQFLQTGKTRGNFQLMALEGGDAEIDPFLFKAMDDLEIRSQLIDYFMKEGSITGAERYIIETKSPIKGVGVEDANAYMENLKHFQNTHALKEGIRKDLVQIQNILRQLKPQVFTPELKEMNEKSQQFAEMAIPFTEFCAYLSKNAKDLGVPTDVYTNFTNVLKMVEMEKAYDKEKLQAEKTGLVQTLQSKMVQEESKILLEKTLLFKLGKISNVEYYDFLIDMAKKAAIDIGGYPNLVKFAESTKVFAQIKIATVSGECDSICEALKEKLYKNPEQRDLDQLDMQIASMNRLLDLSLTREELTRYEEKRGQWTGPSIAQFLKRMTGNYGLETSLRGAEGDEAISSLTDRFTEMHGFY